LAEIFFLDARSCTWERSTIPELRGRWRRRCSSPSSASFAPPSFNNKRQKIRVPKILPKQSALRIPAEPDSWNKYQFMNLLSPNFLSGWPDCANFRPMGDCLKRAVF
jgi:hypothetical protein